MKKLVMAITMLFVMAMSTFVWAAGTMTEDYRAYGGLHVAELTWTTSSTGTFDAGAMTKSVNGFVVGVETVPDGTATPTDEYDLTLTDSNSFDIMDGALGDRSDTDTEYKQPLNDSMGAPVEGILTLGISNAGNSKSGVVKIFYYAD